MHLYFFYDKAIYIDAFFLFRSYSGVLYAFSMERGFNKKYKKLLIKIYNEIMHIHMTSIYNTN